MRTLVLSDVHAGGPGTRVRSAEQLALLFDGFDRIIYNGDCAEFCWRLIPRPPHEWVDALRSVASRDGREVIWIRGNHDLPAGGAHLFQDGGVLYTHGHGLSVPRQNGRTGLSAPVREHFERLDEKCERGLCIRLRFPRTWRSLNAALRLVPESASSRLLSASGFRRKVSRFIELYAKKPVRAVVVGHYHFTRIDLLAEGVRYYQTGAWYIQTRPSVLVADGEQLRLHWVRRARGGFALGAPVTGRHPMPHGLA